MSYTAAELLAVAAAEVGYHEKAGLQHLDDPAADPGSANNTKYARDLCAAGYYGGRSKQSFAWCCCFTDWCHWVASGRDADEARRVSCQSGIYGAACTYAARYYRAAGRLDASPRPGDQVFFGNSDTVFDHTGLVESVTDTTVTVIEGNASDAVLRRTYSRTNSRLRAFGHPLYAPEVSGSEPTTKESLPLGGKVAAELPDEGSQLHGESACDQEAAAQRVPEEVPLLPDVEVSPVWDPDPLPPGADPAGTGAETPDLPLSGIVCPDGPGEPPEQPTVSGLPTLRRGDRGGAVRALQLLLNGKHAACLEVDGSFGSKTRQAVLAWQDSRSLEVDGVCGPITWHSLLTQ